MTKFFTEIIIGVLTSDKVKQMVEDMLNKIVTERLIPLIPVVTASAAKAAVDQMVDKIPGMEGVVDIVQVADTARHTLNELIPDIDLPFIGSLTDFWRPKG